VPSIYAGLAPSIYAGLAPSIYAGLAPSIKDFLYDDRSKRPGAEPFNSDFDLFAGEILSGNKFSVFKPHKGVCVLQGLICRRI